MLRERSGLPGGPGGGRDPWSRAVPLGLAAVLLWSTAATAFELALRSASPCMVVLISSAFSLAFLAAWNAMARTRPTRADLVSALPRGFLNPFVYYLVLLEAYDRLPAQVAMVVNYVWPVMLVLMHSVAKRKRPRAGGLLAMAVSFGGVAVLALLQPGGTRSADAAGLALALASTVIWAGYWLLNLGSGSKGSSDPARLMAGFAWGTLFLLLFALATGRFEAPGIGTVLAGGWIGLFEMGLTYVIWSRALSVARDPAEVGNLIYITPFLSLGFIAVVLGEPLRPATLAGLALVLTGILIERNSSRREAARF